MPDAIFCAKFALTLHQIGTPHFSSLQFYDLLLNKHTSFIMNSCTEGEAGRLAVLLNEALQISQHWRSSEAVYESKGNSSPFHTDPPL